VYGFTSSIQGNVCHLEGQKLLYPAGQFFAVMGTHADDGKVKIVQELANINLKVMRQLLLPRHKLTAALQVWLELC
jgi:hypothetical protein